MLEEFGYVAVTHSADQHDVLGEGGLATAQGACHHQHGLDCSHTEVVVVLFTQLLG